MKLMVDWLLIFVLILSVLLSMLINSLQGSLSSISGHEIRERAKRQQRGAKGLFHLHARGYEVIVSFVILRVLLAVSVIMILIALLPPILSIPLSVLLLTFLTELVGRFFLQGMVLQQLDWLLPVLDKLILITLPVARPVGRLLDKRFAKRLPIIHGKQHLIAMLEQHKESLYSDIQQSEIEIAEHALSFGDLQIRKIMIPKSAVKAVDINEPVGPILMDELHKSGHTRFPVISAKQVVGTLYLRSLLGEDPRGKVKDFMSSEVYYVHEEMPLSHALDAFIKTKHHLFIVVNSFEEFVGIVTLEDVIEQIIGKPAPEEFEDYDNLKAVAGLQNKKDHPLEEQEVIE